ncbi:ABC transporter permease [bacterium]|nr:ABC transporter permease [bacterium]
MRPLIQKELREHQLFFFLSLAFVLLSVTILIIFKHKINKNNIEWIQMLFYIAVPFIFAVLFGTLPFTKEFTQNTKPFLLTHPVSSTKIFWIKIFTALASLLILLVSYILRVRFFLNIFTVLKIMLVYQEL